MTDYINHASVIHSMPWQLLGNLLRNADNHVTFQGILRMARTCLVYQNASSHEISSEHLTTFLEGVQHIFKVCFIQRVVELFFC